MNDNKHVLKNVASKILEEWALMLVEESPGTSIFEVNEPLYAASMHFEGVFHGTILILAQQKFLNTLTCNLLGLDSQDQVQEKDAQDAFREMANVVLGNFLTEAYGPDTPFILTNPSITKSTVDEEKGHFDSTRFYGFLADGIPIGVTFDVRG